MPFSNSTSRGVFPTKSYKVVAISTWRILCNGIPGPLIEVHVYSNVYKDRQNLHPSSRTFMFPSKSTSISSHSCTYFHPCIGTYFSVFTYTYFSVFTYTYPPSSCVFIFRFLHICLFLDAYSRVPGDRNWHIETADWNLAGFFTIFRNLLAGLWGSFLRFIETVFRNWLAAFLGFSCNFSMMSVIFL